MRKRLHLRVTLLVVLLTSLLKLPLPAVLPTSLLKLLLPAAQPIRAVPAELRKKSLPLAVLPVVLGTNNSRFLFPQLFPAGIISSGIFER